MLVRVELDDGTDGWGECGALARPTYTAEHLDGAWDVLRRELVPAALAGRPSGVVGHPMAAAALADAQLDAELRAGGERLATRLGATASSVPTTTVIGVESGDLDALLARVEAAPGGVKVKVAPGWLIEPLRAVRRAWPERWVAADANGSLDPDDHTALAELDELDLAYVEQPVPGLAGSADVAARLATPVCLDEAVASLDDAVAAHRLGALGALNVKPARLGGVEAAAAVVGWTVDAGIPAFVGGMLETGVGRAAAVAVAALPGCTLPTDLGPSDRYWDDDLTEPLVLDDAGRLVVPIGAGSGAVPRPTRLVGATVAMEVLGG